MTWVAAMMAMCCAVDRRRVRREGLRGVLADAEDGVARLCPVGQRRLQTRRAAVLAVVVGLGDQGDSGALERAERRGRRVEDVLLGLGVGTGPVGEGRLEVDHGEVDPRQELRARVGPRRVGGSSASRSPKVGAGREVDVAAEGERDRLPVALPVRIEPRVAGMGGGRRRAGGRSVALPGGAGVSAPAVETKTTTSTSTKSPMAQMPRLRLTRRDVRSGGPGGPGGPDGGAGATSGAGRESRSVGDVRQL